MATKIIYGIDRRFLNPLEEKDSHKASENNSLGQYKQIRNRKTRSTNQQKDMN